MLAGIAVHLIVALRASIPSHLPLLGISAGLFYPDCFYNCLGLSQTGEYNHWTPFLKELVEYRSQLVYKDPDLDLFIYGVLTHQLADIPWHSLRTSEGLLRYLNNVEFENDENFDTAHGFLDTGGDFILLNRYLGNTDDVDRLIDVLLTEWKIPYDHLVAVYRKLGLYHITRSKIEYCMLRGYSGLRLEISSYKANKLYQLRSPILSDLIEDYFLGGLQDIVSTIDSCLPNLDRWLDDFNYIKDPKLICSTFHNTVSQSPGPMGIQRSVDNVIISPMIPKSYFGSSIAIGNFINNELCVAVGAPFEQSTGSVYVFPIDEFNSVSTFTSIQSERHMRSSFGSQLLTFADKYLIVSDPSSNSVSVFDQNVKVLQVEYRSNSIKHLGSILQRYNNDIVIGSKYSDYKSPEQGVLFVLDSKLFLKYLLQPFQHNKIINMNQLIKKTIALPLELRQKSHFENFGSSFASTDDWGLVGVQNLGVVLVYYRDDVKFVIDSSLEVHDSLKSFPKTSSLENQQFGSNFISFFKFNNKTYLIIGMKSYSSTHKQSGLAFIWEVGPEKLTTVKKIGIDQDFASIFSNALITNNCLYIVSQSYENRGAIWRLQLSNLVSSPDDEYKLEPRDLIVTGPQNSGFTGFGHSILVVDSKLIVGMPYQGYSEPSPLYGQVGIYDL